MKRTVALAVSLAVCSLAVADETLLPVNLRFADPAVSEEPSLQKHVVPLLGRLGCNGRACHGSFQGAGGFQLSLFGYDFQFDHEALTKAGEGRVNLQQPLESLILKKPTSDDDHEGGKRYEPNSWQFHVLRRWIEAGAKFDPKQVAKLTVLEVTPSEIVFAQADATSQLKAVAVWADGTREDVTPLCRFSVNNDQIAKVNEDGMVSAGIAGDTHVVVSYDKAVITIPVLRPVSDRTGEKYPQVASNSKIDELVVTKLRKLGIVPSDRCDDATFLRRVSLDLAGTLPTAKEVEDFVANPSPTKRGEKVEELLATPAYAAWWTTKFCDWTGNNDQQLNNVSPVRGKPGQEWYDWIYKRVSDNTPYDELAAGIVLAQSRKEDETYLQYCQSMSKLYAKDSPEGSYADRPYLAHYWARNNLRQPEDRAVGFAYAFMGVRIQCAQCHKHPFDTWSKQDFEDFKAFFTRVAFNRNAARDNKDDYEQILKDLGVDPKKKGNQLDRDLQKLVAEGKTIPFGEVVALPPRKAPPPKNRKNDKDKKGNQRPTPMQVAKLLGQDEQLNLNEYGDARKPLMDWLRSPDNPYFARAFVNRVWANYFNIGIVEPPDDMSLGNPPSNKELLDYLAKGFIEHRFDMKWLHREIIASDTYQRSWRTNETNAADERNFSHSVPRRLAAEVAYDAIQRATASDERAAAMLTELRDRGIAVPTSNANANAAGRAGFALKVFGRSTRESNCDCDRTMEASLLQTVYLQNDNDVLAALNPGTKGTWISEVNALLNPPTPKRPQNKGNPQRDLVRVKIRLEAAKKLEDQAQIERLERRVKQLEDQLAKSQAERDDADEEKAAPPQPSATKPEPASLVRQAYLRTLSREPDPSELDRCVQFIAQADTPVKGLRDLMWALINTKEFIVNH